MPPHPHGLTTYAQLAPLLLLFSYLQQVSCSFVEHQDAKVRHRAILRRAGQRATLKLGRKDALEDKARGGGMIEAMWRSQMGEYC